MRIRAVFAAAALAAALVGCGSGESAEPTTATDAPTTTAAAGPDLSAEEFDDLTGSDAVDVQARDNSFVPQYIEVDPGTTITFTNRGRTEHNVIAVEEDAFPTIDAEMLVPGGTGTITLDEPGDYAYYCSLHGTTTKGMVGAVRVLGE